MADARPVGSRRLSSGTTSIPDLFRQESLCMCDVKPPRRLLAPALACALLAAVGLAGSASAAAPNDVVFSGTSVATVELTLADQTAAFGTTLTPNGGASTGSDTLTVNTDASASKAGSCYEWASQATVSSNKNYGINVTPSAGSSRLTFLDSNPANYAACTSGTTLIIATAILFVVEALPTATRDHPFYLGLDVRWTDLPAAFTATTLVFTITQTG
jgi:hypothetical protein